jgi:2-dehydropantoate 2-reductase
MKTLVYGAGAIGGYLGAILSAAGHDVTLVARGAQFDALSSRGIILEGPKSGRPEPIRVKAVRPADARGAYDLLFVTLKSHQIAEVAPHLRSLAAKDATFVFPQNGIPWWYFDGIPSPRQGTRLATVDPDGILARTFRIEEIVGGVVFKPSDLVEPGRIRLADSPSDALSIGEVDNRITPRLDAIAKLVGPAGWPVNVTDDIRKVKWGKLLANAVWNPLGAITQGTATHLAQFGPTRDLAVAMIGEVMAIAAAVGVPLEGSPAEIVAGVAKRASLPSSTMQDVRAGKSLELDAIINAVLEIAGLCNVPTPSLAVVAACAGMVNRRIVEDGVAIAPVKVRN